MLLQVWVPWSPCYISVSCALQLTVLSLVHPPFLRVLSWILYIPVVWEIAGSGQDSSHEENTILFLINK